MVELRARLPKEDAAVLLAAIEGVRRTSLGHHHPNPGRAVIKRSQTRCPVSGCTAAQMRCWMWPGCF